VLLVDSLQSGVLGKQAQQREKSHSHTNKLLDAEKAEKLIKIYRFDRTEEDNQ